MHRKAQSQDGHDSAPPPETVGGVCAPEKVSKRELLLLYEESVYTVMNKVGVPCPGYVRSDGELLTYLQKVFDIEPELQKTILQKVRESKRASYSLKVSVIEGRNLMAKDANGYSDPYCMLGILLAVSAQSPREQEEKKERKKNFLKKKDKMERHSSAKELLSDKCIQVTEVKPETLNPVWNEHFVFEIDDPFSDILCLDIWDHDDDVSVTEACKKLNEVSGLKGMGRFVKQIRKSVRSNGNAASTAEENVDDFLGCLRVPINEIPADGCDRWFKLEPRSSASQVQGECHLTLKLFTTQRDTPLSKRDSHLAIHEKLLSHLIGYEHSQVQVEPDKWAGKLSLPAQTVLSHHAVQVDLSPLQRAIMWWKCYSSRHRSHQMCYSFLLGLLRKIEEEWDAPSVQGELEAGLANSFRLHTVHCLSLLGSVRQEFPCSSPTAVARCDVMLRTLGLIHAMRAFKTACPSSKELQLQVSTVVKKSTVEWYEGIISQYKPDEGTLEEKLGQLVLVVDTVCEDVQSGHDVYNKLFSSSVKVEYFSVAFRELEKLVAGDVGAAMKMARGTQTNTTGKTLFQLYMSLKTLKLFSESLPLGDTKMLALTRFHEWFETYVHMWLQMVHEKSCDRIHRAVEVDKLEPEHSLSKHSTSTSAVDVIACFIQVQKFWAQLAWPDSVGAFIFLTCLTDDLCSAAVLYCELMKREFERRQLSLDRTLTSQLCIALNNIEHVRAFLGDLPRALDWQGLEKAMEESYGEDGKGQVKKSINAQLCNMDAALQREAKRMVSYLTDKMILDLKKYILHISLSPDKNNNDDAVSPLMKYLNDMLVLFSESLQKENLARVLQGLWCVLLRMLIDTVADNRKVSPAFYGRFYFTVEALVEFFHAEGGGLSLKDLRNKDYKALKEELRSNKCSSNELIEGLYLERIARQRKLMRRRFGRISVKCNYEASDQRLTVEILHAADLIAMDTNGLSDPFVIVELCPRHLFPAVKSQQTAVKPKTLNPIFEELFHFHISPEQNQHSSACVTFTVMDYDWLSSNDFIGEAILPLSNVCGRDTPGSHVGGTMVQPLILHLSRPNASETPILKMLEARTTDKVAQEFVKKHKEIQKSVGEKK